MKKQLKFWLMVMIATMCFAGCDTTDPYVTEDTEVTSSSSTTVTTKPISPDEINIKTECNKMTLTLADIHTKYQEYYNEWLQLACRSEIIGSVCDIYDETVTLTKMVCQNSYDENVSCNVNYRFILDPRMGDEEVMLYIDEGGKLDSADVVKMITLDFPDAILKSLDRECTVSTGK